MFTYRPARLDLLHETRSDHSGVGIHARHHRVLR